MGSFHRPLRSHFVLPERRTMERRNSASLPPVSEVNTFLWSSCVFLSVYIPRPRLTCFPPILWTTLIQPSSLSFYFLHDGFVLSRSNSLLSLTHLENFIELDTYTKTHTYTYIVLLRAMERTRFIVPRSVRKRWLALSELKSLGETLIV